MYPSGEVAKVHQVLWKWKSRCGQHPFLTTFGRKGDTAFFWPFPDQWSRSITTPDLLFSGRFLKQETSHSILGNGTAKKLMCYVNASSNSFFFCKEQPGLVEVDFHWEGGKSNSFPSTVAPIQIPSSSSPPKKKNHRRENIPNSSYFVLKLTTLGSQPSLGGNIFPNKFWKIN